VAPCRSERIRDPVRCSHAGEQSRPPHPGSGPPEVPEVLGHRTRTNLTRRRPSTRTPPRAGFFVPDLKTRSAIWEGFSNCHNLCHYPRCLSLFTSLSPVFTSRVLIPIFVRVFTPPPPVFAFWHGGHSSCRSALVAYPPPSVYAAFRAGGERDSKNAP
jgi:hypothetical protein